MKTTRNPRKRTTDRTIMRVILCAGGILLSLTAQAQQPAASGRTRGRTVVRKDAQSPGAARPSEKEEQTASDWDAVREAQKLELGIEYRKPRPTEKFSFNLVDADLIELVKIIGNISGKSFIIGGDVPKIKATIYAPTKINSREAYRTFLSVLQVNGLTVIPSGRYLKIVKVANPTSEKTPILTNVPDQDQIVTRLHKVEYVSAEELAGLLGRFKSANGDITVYAPTNTLIITDYGSSIRRLIRLIGYLDIPGSNEQIYVEPVNYASASELAQKIEEIFEIKNTGKSSPVSRGKKKPGTDVTVAGESSGIHYSKVIPDERSNSLIIVASEEGYLRILELIKVLDVQVAGEGTLHVVKLQHADATEMTKSLSMIAKQSSSRGQKGKEGGVALFEDEVQVSADVATNSLVIVSTQRDFASLRKVINQLDTMKRQVFVEAVIMEVSLDKNRKFGMGVHGGKEAFGAGDDRGVLYGINAFPNQASSLFINPSDLAGLSAGALGPQIEIAGLSVPAFGVALQALQTNNDVNVLSTPHILATDNTEASITVGENVPVLQGVNSSAALLGALAGQGNTNNALASLGGGSLAGLTNSYSRQDVGITLAITPHINEDNQVRLEVDLEISGVKSNESPPTISKKKAKTTSVVGDQQTFVLGGLITDNEVETISKTPVLGDIPLIGALFRHKAKLVQKNNLLIFLTPYIIRSSDDFRLIYERKMAERREFIERYTAFEYHRYDPHLDWTRTKGAVSIINDVIGRAEEDAELTRQSQRVEEVSHDPKAPIDFSGATGADRAVHKREDGAIVIEAEVDGE